MVVLNSNSCVNRHNILVGSFNINGIFSGITTKNKSKCMQVVI